MASCLGVVFLAIFSAFFPFQTGHGAEPTLKFLSFIHRHGERAPIETYPTDPYKNDSYWPEGREELLRVGKVNMHNLGRFIRARYDGFIPRKYKATDLLVRSTATNRAIMSAQLVLSGLYPPHDEQVWDRDIWVAKFWQPIPVQVLAPSIDDMLCVSRVCPLLYEDRKNFTGGPYQDIREENQEVLKYIQNHTGLDFESDSDIGIVYDNLLIEEEQGLKLPEWTKKVWPDTVISLYRRVSVALKKNPTYTKINSGVLINDLLTTMRKKINETESFSRFFNLYAAHDTTILGLWRGLGIKEPESWPSFGALFIVELHEIENKHLIKILYKNRATDEGLKVLSIRDCTKDNDKEGWCDFEVLETLMQDAVVTNYDEECYSPSISAADIPNEASC
nr:PREDICTED: testicular acid phosphatase homolog [Bemisia tabaci]